MDKRRLFSTGAIFFIILLIAGAGFVFFKDMEGPVVEIEPASGRISPNSSLKIKMSDKAGIRSLAVGIRKNNVFNIIYEKHFDEYLPEREVEVPLKNAQLREGSFELETRATDASLAGFGQGNTRTKLTPMRLDTQPPRITLQTLPPNVRRGGAAVIRYTINEPVSKNGALIAGYFVPGYLQKDGSYLCFFPFPYTMTARDFKNQVQITATDLAGNVTQSRLNVTALERSFKSDKINLSDDFLAAVENKLKHLAPDAKTSLECYLYINNQVRAANVEMLRNIRLDTSAAMLWSGVFLRLPRSATRAGYADHRYFNYQGKMVGESYHLGFDMASVRNAEVPAANSGRIIFTGEQGIYGNLIIIDHGLGLMSMYSHLSEIFIKPGDLVQKGQIIGKTGSTGLAFGDHLHFGILVGGIEVTPLEWIDPKWIRDNVMLRVGEDLAPAQAEQAK